MGADDRVATAAYQPEPMAAAAARRFVRDTLRGWMAAGPPAGGRALIDDAVLLTSELVTNAVVHAGTPVHVTCRLAGGGVEIEVSDGHPARWVPEPAENEISPAERTSGRGLLLPSALASAWGVTYGQASKSVWFRLGQAVTGAGQGSEPDGTPGRTPADGAPDDRQLLAAALRTPGHPGGLSPPPAPASGYGRTLEETAEAARSAMAADAALLLMADEDGDLRPRAAAGVMPHAVGSISAAAARLGAWPVASMPASTGPAPSVLTVPLLVEGRFSGLLAVISSPPRRFSEAEAARLQRLADACGPPLQRAWLAELERARRARASAFADMRRLLADDLAHGEIMAIAGQAAVPRLVPWCVVLLRSGGAELRVAHARHSDPALEEPLSWLLGRACEPAVLEASWWRQADGHGVRWPLALPVGAGAPAGADQLAGDTAWSFPFRGPDGPRGLLVIGNGRDGRLPREVAALAADLACRVGLALTGARLAGRGASG